MFEVFENPERLSYEEVQNRFTGKAVGAIDIEFNIQNDESSGIGYVKVKAITNIGSEDPRMFELFQSGEVESILYCVEPTPGFMGGVMWK